MVIKKAYDPETLKGVPEERISYAAKSRRINLVYWDTPKRLRASLE